MWKVFTVLLLPWQGQASPKHCTVCKTLVKDHPGPHDKDRCVVGLVGALRSRVDALEETIRVNELRYAMDLADQAALFDKRIEGLLAIVEDLQSRFESSAAGSRPSVAEAPISSVECSPSETLSVTEPNIRTRVRASLRTTGLRDTQRL